MKNKKAVEVHFLIMLLIGISVFLVLAFIIPRLIGKGSAEASSNLDSTKDYDGDGISDIFDKCKCEAADTRDGCPGSYDAAQKDASNCKECKPKPKGCQ